MGFAKVMNARLNLLSPRYAALALCAAVWWFNSAPLLAEENPAKANPKTTWQDLGFSRVPEGISEDMIPLFEGLNQARGTWSFEGEIAHGETVTPQKCSLHVAGNPQRGMIPMWQMAWKWSVDQAEQSLFCIVHAAPSRTGFELMLIRIGPMTKIEAAQDKRGVSRTMFRGVWNLENRTITWTASDLRNRLAGPAAKEDAAKQGAAKPKQAFDMVVAVDGKISIQNSKHASLGQWASGKAVVRTGKAPADDVTLTGKHRFQTVVEIKDSRIQSSLPPQATDIALFSARGGHYARYKVAEADFMKFLDKLWEAKKDSSAHKRPNMAGEGEPASRERMAQRFKTLGWEPLDNAITYYSPSKRTGAMTTYYYDREAGIAYHDTGYW